MTSRSLAISAGTAMTRAMTRAMTKTMTMTTTQLVALLWMLAGRGGILALTPHCYSSWKMQASSDARLTSSVFHSAQSRSVAACAQSCFFSHEGTCKSFSYHKASRMCELSSVSTRMRNVYTTSASGWRYYLRKVIMDTDLANYGSRHCYYEPCPPGSLFHSDICFVPQCANCTIAGDIAAAHASCRSKFGVLARIYSTTLLSALAPKLYGHLDQKFYVDLRRLGNAWAWEDGTLFSVPSQLWNPGQPDNYAYGEGPEDCIGLEQTANFHFNDVPCNLCWAYVCQYGKRVYTLW